MNTATAVGDVNVCLACQSEFKERQGIGKDHFIDLDKPRTCSSCHGFGKIKY
ncbi:MAG: hypothetical protein ABH887_02420 [bacterium]